jgi:hypothetical protein
MTDTGWRAWSWLVQLAAFTAVAGLMSLLISLGLGGHRLYPFVFTVVLVLSIPFGLLPYAIARRAGKLGWRDAAIIGLLAGTLFGLLVVFGQPVGMHSSSDGDIALSRDGVPTLHFMVQSAAFCGLCAAIGGLGGLLLKCLLPPDLLLRTRTPIRPQRRDALPLAVAFATVAAVPIIEQDTQTERLLAWPPTPPSVDAPVER